MKHTTKIFVEDCVLVENKLYFFSRDWNALYTVNLRSKEITFVSRIPEEDVLAKRLCAGIVHYKGKLIFSPMMAKKIWIYDLENNQWIGLERKRMVDEEFCQEIFRAIKYKNYLLFIGSNYPAIIRMDLDTYELSYLTEPYAFLKPLKDEVECYFRYDCCLKNNQLLLASCLNNYVLCINLDTFDFSWCEVGDKGFRYSGIVWDGKDYWLSPRTGTPIVRWNGKDIVEYIPLPEELRNEMYNFLGITYHDGKVILPGMLQNKTLIIEPNTYNESLKICNGQYTFYRCSEENDVLAQNTDALLWGKNPNRGGEFNICCELSTKELIDYFVHEGGFISGWQVWMESSFPVLPLCIASLKREVVPANRKLEYGVNIWRAVQD